MLALRCGFLLRLSDWLDGEPIEGFSFDATRWTEQPDVDAKELAEALGREVSIVNADRGWLEHRLKRLGYDRLAGARPRHAAAIHGQHPDR